MKRPQGQLRVRWYFAALVVIVAGLYALVFFTGPGKVGIGKAKPKLGLDLQGGVSMTLSATQPDGKAPSPDQLSQARSIIDSRVNGTGVAEPEVVTEGDKNIVVNVAGKETTREELQKLVAPAKLRFRKVLSTTPDAGSGDPSPAPSGTPTPNPSGTPNPSVKPSATPTAGSTPTPTKALNPGEASNADLGLASDGAGFVKAHAPESPSPKPSAAPSASPSPPPLDAKAEEKLKEVQKKLGAAYQMAATLKEPLTKPEELAQAQAALAPFAKLTGDEVAVLPVDMQMNVPTISCKQLNDRRPGAIEDEKKPVVACGKDAGSQTYKYKLDVAKVLGEDVKNADFTFDTQQGGWIVNLQFKGEGQDRWTKLTEEAIKANPHDRVAVVLDNQVVSAPEIKDRIAGDAQISGSFTQDEAKTLAAQLKYGSLPLTFTTETVDEVTPTLGTEQMKAGLLAGAIGLLLVIIYCFIYYRALGLVVVTSLAVSGSIVFASLVLLGRQMGYTLTLAGIAGLIVAVGITADSFVVYFERIKDEVHQGRSVRSAVPRAWALARRTILSADTVLFLSAAVLYLLAAGPVKGFAFTLGLSTIIDLIIVFLFTHPLVALLSRWRLFTSPRVSGLGNARPDTKAGSADKSPRVRGLLTKES